MNPLLLQIAIGLGGLVVGFLIGTVAAGKRLRNTREAARQLADDYESQLAMKRLQIHELEARHAGPDAADPPSGDAAEPEPNSLQMLRHPPTRPKWLATPTEPVPDSAPPRA